MSDLIKPRLRASMVCVHDDHLLCVKLRDPLTKIDQLFVPGGAIEDAERPAQTAERETLEETGYQVIADVATELVVDYPFLWNGITYQCQTYFYRGHLSDPQQNPARVKDASYNEGVLWLPVADIRNRLAFHQVILDAVLKLY